VGDPVVHFADDLQALCAREVTRHADNSAHL
jgi:hypothetical protein